jgi:CopG-like RHH_1 or ribbon-helix-helix domain, RHH_5
VFVRRCRAFGALSALSAISMFGGMEPETRFTMRLPRELRDALAAAAAADRRTVASMARVLLEAALERRREQSRG